MVLLGSSRVHGLSSTESWLPSGFLLVLLIWGSASDRALSEISSDDWPAWDQSLDSSASASILIDGSGTVRCSANTTSLFHFTAVDVNATVVDDAPLKWVISYRPLGAAVQVPRDTYVPFNESSLTISVRQPWFCPADLGIWNVTVRVCGGTFDCPDPTSWRATNSTVLGVQVGMDSRLVAVNDVTGCRDDINATVDVDAYLFPLPSWRAGTTLNYRFKFQRASAVTPPWLSEQQLAKKPSKKSRKNSDSVIVTNQTHAFLQKPWFCHGNEAGNWTVFVEIRENMTGALLAYANTTLYITEFLAELTVNSTTSMLFNCSTPTALHLAYAMPGAQAVQKSLLWTINGTTRVAPINGSVNAPSSDSQVLMWPCPSAYGVYTIMLQVLDMSKTIDNLMAQAHVGLEVAALLSSTLKIKQNSHNRIREKSPMAVGELALSLDNVLVKDTGLRVDAFFNMSTVQVYYEWWLDDRIANMTTATPNITYNYTMAGVYAPSVRVQVMSNDGTALGVPYATGIAKFPDLSLVAFVSSISVEGPQQLTAGQVETNYTVTCMLSSESGIIESNLCWNLTLVETNSSLNVPYYTGCVVFDDVDVFNQTFGHAFNVTGIYNLDYNCSNDVSSIQNKLGIYIDHPPTPAKVPVVSYTLPLVLTMVIAVAGFSVLGVLVHRHRKNRHIQVADFDYMRDWEDPRPRTLKDRLIEKMGRVCGCLPGPWHWKKSQRTQRYLSLTMRTNTADYGATGSFNMSLS